MKRAICIICFVFSIAFSACRVRQPLNDKTSSDSTLVKVTSREVEVKVAADSARILLSPGRQSRDTGTGFVPAQSTVPYSYFPWVNLGQAGLRGKKARVVQSFKWHNKQSSGEAKVLSTGELEIVSKCDSLAQRVTVLDSVISHSHKEYVNRVETKEIQNPVNHWLLLLLLLCAIVIAVLCFVLRIKR